MRPSRPMTTRCRRCCQQTMSPCLTLLGPPARRKLVSNELVRSPVTPSFDWLTFSLAGYDQALSQWRVLSAYLRPAPKNDPSYLSQRDATVSAAAATFTNALSPWASETYSDSVRRQNLAEILKSAAEVGILIFSQPGSFRFQWSTGQDHRSVVVVIAPALLKTADEHAIPLDRPQVMIQMATQSI